MFRISISISNLIKVFNTNLIIFIYQQYNMFFFNFNLKIFKINRVDLFNIDLFFNKNNLSRDFQFQHNPCNKYLLFFFYKDTFSIEYRSSRITSKKY